MKVGCYARCSTEHQSLESQIEKLESYCKARGWTEITIYKDAGVSGAKSSRPALNALMLDARKRRLDCIVITKMDRLGRSLAHLINTLREFDEIGVKCVFIEDAIDFTTSAGRFMAHMLGAVAEFEREIIKDRIVSGIRRAQAKGVKFGAPIRLRHELIRSLHKQGKSMNAIARELKCSPGAVHKILKA